MVSPIHLLALTNLACKACADGSQEPDEGAAQLVHLSLKAANLRQQYPDGIPTPSKMLSLHLSAAAER